MVAMEAMAATVLPELTDRTAAAAVLADEVVYSAGQEVPGERVDAAVTAEMATTAAMAATEAWAGPRTMKAGPLQLQGLVERAAPEDRPGSQATAAPVAAVAAVAFSVRRASTGLPDQLAGPEFLAPEVMTVSLAIPALLEVVASDRRCPIANAGQRRSLVTKH